MGVLKSLEMWTCNLPTQVLWISCAMLLLQHSSLQTTAGSSGCQALPSSSAHTCSSCCCIAAGCKKCCHNLDCGSGVSGITVAVAVELDVLQCQAETKTQCKTVVKLAVVTCLLTH
jgi:hypothetical protein